MNQIKLPVHVWHGKADTIVPVRLAEFMINNLPDVHSHLIEGVGHFMALEYSKEIFSNLTQDRRLQTADVRHEM